MADSKVLGLPVVTSSGVLTTDPIYVVANGVDSQMLFSEIAKFIYLQTSAQLNTSGILTFTSAVSRVIPGATSLSFRNNANAADNLIITDAGLITVRGSISGITALSLSATITMSAAASQIIPGATSFSIRNNANSQDNLLVLDNGNVTVTGNLFGKSNNPSGISIGFTTVAGISHNAGDNALYLIGNSIFAAKVREYGFGVIPTAMYGFLSGSLTAGGIDTALGRTSAGILEINNGTLGTFRDLNVRNLTSSGVVSVSSSLSGTLPISGAGILTVINTSNASNRVVASFVLTGANPDIGLDIYCSVNQEMAIATYKYSSGAARVLNLNPNGNSVKVNAPLMSPSTGGAAVNGQTTLVGGTKTVNTTAASATSRVFVQRVTAGGTIGNITITKVAGTSFTINSDNVLDTSTFDWYIIESF